MHKRLTQLKEDYPVVYRNEDGSSYFWIDDLVKIKGVADNWSYNLMRQEFLRLSEYINNLEILLFMLAGKHPAVKQLGFRRLSTMDGPEQREGYDEYGQWLPGYRDSDEFYEYFNHHNETIDHIMSRWSNEVENVYGEATITSDGQLHIHYEYDRYDSGKDWYLPIAVLWDLDGEIAKAKAQKEAERLAKEQRETAQKERSTQAHILYIQEEAKRLGLIQGGE
jgi:hypothetical protein